MSTSTTYENAVDAARSGARAVGDRLPLDRIAGIDWSDTPLSDVTVPDFDLDDVLDDVGRAVRRYPVGTLAIVIASVLATCGIVWFVTKRRKPAADEQAELSLAGAA